MHSAFGVDHGEEISKIGLQPVKDAFTAFKGGFKLKNTVKPPAGQSPFKSPKTTAWNAGAHLGRNKNAYGAGAAAGTTGLGIGSMFGNRNR